MTKSTLSIALLSVALLAGCGGSSKKDAMNGKKYILIYTEIIADSCEAPDFKEYFTSLGYQEVLIRETNNDTSCQTYGKNNDGNECYMAYLGGGDKNCVIGFNTYPDQKQQEKVISKTNLYEVAEILTSAL